MPRKTILLFILIILLSPRSFGRANLQINEIMYDLKTGSDDGREWVEIYNGSNIPVDLSTYKFFEADTNHKIKLAQGSTNVGAFGYAIIVSDLTKFKTDWSGVAGTIYDSTFSLSNSGETLAIKNIQQDSSLNVVDQFVYSSSMGGAGDSNSLQKINGVWQGAKPTPGEENKITFIPPPSPKIESVPAKISTVQNKQNKTATKIEIPTDSQTSTINQSITPKNTETGVVNTVENNNNNPYFFIGLLVLLLGISGGAVYFIRRKKNILQNRDDF